jgi:hypothetical protein
MPTLTIGTPEQLSSLFGATGEQGCIRLGPFKHGTDHYFVIVDDQAVSGNNTFFICKRDAIGTWTTFGDGGVSSAWFVGLIHVPFVLNDTLYLFTNDLDRTPGHYWLHPFDMSTDTMGARIDTGISVSADVESPSSNWLKTLAGVAVRSNGTVLFGIPTDSETISLQKYNRSAWLSWDGVSTWTGPTAMSGQAGNSRSYGCFSVTNRGSLVSDAFVLSSDGADQNTPSPNNFWLHHISDNSGTPATFQTVATTLNINCHLYLTYGPVGLPLYYVNGASTPRLVIPFVGGSTSQGLPVSRPGPSNTNFVAVCDANVADPTWNLIEYDNTTQNYCFTEAQEAPAIPMYIGGNLFLIWCSSTAYGNNGSGDGPTEGSLVYSASTDDGATWQAPATLLPLATPLVASGLSPSAENDALVYYQVDSTKWTSFQRNLALKHFYFSVASSAPAISIACPVAPLTATVGVFYTSDPPVVTGDTPPDTFVLLTGPSWMTIDASTGVVSGTPDAEGAVTYTIQVTDSLGTVAVVAAPCPLTVSNPIPPPPFCILVPATPPQALVLYPEPLEQQGT